MMKYSNGDFDVGKGIPARTQKKLGPKGRSAFKPTLHVLLPGTNVLT